jgi:hypothetical protein
MAHPNAFDGMMHEFCVKLGYCGGEKDGKRLHVTHFIPETGPVSADQFARWLIEAERFAPDRLSTSELRRLISQYRRCSSST